MTGIQATEAASLGRTRIARRALVSVVSAVTAEMLGIRAHDVSVDIADDHGLLALVIRAPVPMVSLTRVRRDPALVERAGGSLLARAAHTESHIGERVAALTGMGISHVTLRITGARIGSDRRVK